MNSANDRVYEIFRKLNLWNAFIKITEILFNEAYAQKEEEVRYITPFGEIIFKTPQFKKKKLVYQWVYERNDNIFDTTGEVFGINDRDIVRKYVSNFNAKEGGKLFPLMESEQEIDI